VPALFPLGGLRFAAELMTLRMLQRPERKASSVAAKKSIA